MSSFEQDDPFFRSLRALRSMLADKSSYVESVRDDQNNGADTAIRGAVAEVPQDAVFPGEGNHHPAELVERPESKSNHSGNQLDTSIESGSHPSSPAITSPEPATTENVPNQDPVKSLESDLQKAETKARVEEALRQAMERTLKDVTAHNASVEVDLKNATALNKLLQEEITELQKQEERRRQAILKEKKIHQEEIDKLVELVQSVRSQKDSMEAKMIGAQKMADRLNDELARMRQIPSNPEDQENFFKNEIHVLRAQLIETQNELEVTRQTLKEVTEHHTHSSVDQDVCENPEKMEQELSVLQNTMNRLQQEHSVAVKNALESQNIVEQLKTKILKADVNDHSAKQKPHEVEFLRQRILDLERELEQSKQVIEHSEANVETGRSRREDPGEAEEVSIADENDTEEKEELRKRLAEKSALLEQHKKFSKYAQEKMKSLVDQNTSLKNQLEESEHIQREYEESLQDAESELAKLRKNLNDALKELPRHRFRLDEEDMSSDPEASGNSAEEDQDQSEDDDNDDDDEVEVIDLVKVDRSDEGGEGDTGDDETEEANYYSSDEDQSTAGKLTDKQDHDDAHGSKRKREQSGDSSHEEGCDDIEDDADTADDDEDDLDVVEIVDKPASKKQK